jgi:hypothetical protein
MDRRNFIRKAAVTTAGLGLLFRNDPAAARPRLRPKKAGKRIGMLGPDTGHYRAFTQISNAPDAGGSVPGLPGDGDLSLTKKSSFVFLRSSSQPVQFPGIDLVLYIRRCGSFEDMQSVSRIQVNKTIT